MQALNDEFKEFLRLLTLNHVDYLVIGGYAVGYHGYPRFTGDLDVWVDVSAPNLERLITALKGFGFSEKDLALVNASRDKKILKIGNEPFRIDIFRSIPGVTFSNCFAKQQKADIDGLSIPFISLFHLKKNKKASGRRKDLVDLDYLSKPKKRKRRLR